MRVADNVLKHYLRNVFWLGGYACGGKTTMAKLLAEKHGMVLYNSDDKYKEHSEVANASQQPAMSQTFADSEEFFNRPKEMYLQWLDDSVREEMDMIIMDLVVLAAEQKVVVEGCFSPELIKRIAGYERAIFLYVEPQLLRQDYFNRDGHRQILKAIQNCQNPDKTLNHVLDVLETGRERALAEGKSSGMKYLVRGMDSTVEDTLQKIERHFGL